ncbi:MAG TPA: primosomal protein N' [Vicinamibacterales bacterium]|nr:primosomal protein N' [Vicinamibacterales bacterium]
MPSSPNPTDRIVAVAVPVPGLGVLGYRVPGRAAVPPKGARVRVPLGQRTVVGCVVGAQPDLAPGAALKDVEEVLDEEPFLPPAVVDLAIWVGDYYASGPGDALAIAMPPAARRGRASSFKTVRVAQILPGGSEPVAAEAGASGKRRSTRGSKQQQALDLLRAQPGGLTLTDLLRRGIGTGTIRSLERAGLLGLRDDVVMRDPFGSGDETGGPWAVDRRPTAAPTLTSEQTAAFRRLEEAAATRGFKTVLLHGVTGSGKTELYLRLAGLVTATGRRVLVLTPEIALTPALAGLFRARFGEDVAVQHSGLSDGERHDQWHRIRRGEVSIVVGTRSAVFAPLENLGLIIVDEEHDGSYKQDDLPRYHGRDVAVVRGRMESALVVLGSATPSLESAFNARGGRYGLIQLSQRVHNRPLAEVRIVDMRKEYAAHGADVVFSAPLLEAIADRLDRREQTVVLLNRRGFATVIFCRQCGASIECPHCSVTLTYHLAHRRLRCHYCNYSSAVPRVCGACGGEYLEQAGVGTERLEADLRERFPDARLARVDRDTIRRRGAIAEVLRGVARGTIDIVVGTQMIAKGHDFPAVTLVGVVSADVGLGLADFRASERTFQLLTQVVGRAGRGDTPGKAIVQTLYPNHYSIRAAAAQEYDPFYEREMEFRTNLQYPPTLALINVVVKGRTLDAALTDAHDLAKRIRHHGVHGKVLGPAPAAVSKIRDEHRAQIFIKGRQRKAMRSALRIALDERPELKRRTIVDVDPVSVI